MKNRNSRNARRGVAAPLVAILLIPLLAMMAFSIDIGYAVMARSELVNAADAAALAGVQQLYPAYQQWQLASTNSSKSNIQSNAVTLATATAVSVANSNMVARASVQIVSGDVDVGYTDANGNYYSGNMIPSNSFPNTVKITARRDNTNLPNSNGEVPLFFGPILGKKSVALESSSTAVAYGGIVTGFTSSYKPGPAASSSGAGSSAGSSQSSVASGVLPVAVDMTQWFDFYKNGANSAYADPNAPLGQAWFQIYPGGQGESMDGLLSLNGSKAASQQWYSGGPPNGGWIQCGPTATDLAGLAAAGDLPLPANGTGACWASGPGMKSSLLGDFQAIITSPPTMKLLPLFDPNSPGTSGGGNGTYQICYFVPVYLVYADGHGKANMDIAVVPAPGNPLTDPTVVIGKVQPLGTSSTPQYVVPVPGKLTN
jgi:Flp pilus assembly protein TadG